MKRPTHARSAPPRLARAPHEMEGLLAGDPGMTHRRSMNLRWEVADLWLEVTDLRPEVARSPAGGRGSPVGGSRTSGRRWLDLRLQVTDVRPEVAGSLAGGGSISGWRSIDLRKRPCQLLAEPGDARAVLLQPCVAAPVVRVGTAHQARFRMSGLTGMDNV